MGRSSTGIKHLSQTDRSRASSDKRGYPPSGSDTHYLVSLGWAGLFALYVIVFLLTQNVSGSEAGKRALISVIPALLLSLAVIWIIRQSLIKRSLGVQIPAHATLSITYAILWYLGIQVGYGLQDGWLRRGLSPNQFSSVALAWQLLQGALLYGVIAACTYALHYRDQLRQIQMNMNEDTAMENESQPSPSRLLLRKGRDIVPVDLGDILLISGAGDGVEIRTLTTLYTSSRSLSDLELILPKTDFERVHRSHIIRLDKIIRVHSPGDGRFALTLEGGHEISTSRTGAQRFRQRAA